MSPSNVAWAWLSRWYVVHDGTRGGSGTPHWLPASLAAQGHLEQKKPPWLHPQPQQSLFSEVSVATSGRFTPGFLHQLEAICITAGFYFPGGCEERGAWS